MHWLERVGTPSRKFPFQYDLHSAASTISSMMWMIYPKVVIVETSSSGASTVRVLFSCLQDACVARRHHFRYSKSYTEGRTKDHVVAECPTHVIFLVSEICAERACMSCQFVVHTTMTAVCASLGCIQRHTWMCHRKARAAAGSYNVPLPKDVFRNGLAMRNEIAGAS